MGFLRPRYLEVQVDITLVEILDSPAKLEIIAAQMRKLVEEIKYHYTMISWCKMLLLSNLVELLCPSTHHVQRRR